MNDPIYTQDWATVCFPSWAEMLASLHALDAPRILEIGVFEGRTTRWLLDRFGLAHLVAVDPFAMQPTLCQWEGIRERFEHNIAPHRHRVTVYPLPSRIALPEFLVRDERFDFIYVDGSHEATDVLFDAVMALHLVPVGGLICFDDYTWDDTIIPPSRRPRAALDPWMAIYKRQIEIIRAPDRQLWVQRIK